MLAADGSVANWQKLQLKGNIRSPLSIVHPKHSNALAASIIQEEMSLGDMMKSAQTAARQIFSG